MGRLDKFKLNFEKIRGDDGKGINIKKRTQDKGVLDKLCGIIYQIPVIKRTPLLPEKKSASKGYTSFSTPQKSQAKGKVNKPAKKASR